MATAATIRAGVEQFHREHGATIRVEDAFAPWVLHKRYRLTPQEAFVQSSDGNHDGGVDGFALQRDRDDRPLLYVMQAKLSENPTLVRKGLEDLRRAAGLVERLMVQGDSELPSENRVIQRMRAALYGLDAGWQQGLQVRLVLVHLLKEQELWLSSPNVQKLRRDLLNELGDGALAGRASLEFLGPPELDVADVIPAPAPTSRMQFEGTEFDIPGGDRVMLGLGRIADFVELHERYQHHLFAKNVRMFLRREASKDQSAANQIRQTLEGICNEKLPVEQFALLHNGITLTAARGKREETGVLLEPGTEGIHVLNGCQTVYTSWKFFKEWSKRRPDGAWKSRWERIRVPIRLVLTRDDERIRQVTIGANRQTSINSSAFYAHDPVQLSLEDRFARLNIFYERQQGAWDHLNNADPNHASTFINGRLEIESTARCVAAASRTLGFDLAKSPQRIFDSQEQYKRVFHEKHLRSVRFLLFLDNAYRTTKLVLQDLTKEIDKYEDLQPSRFVIPTFRLLVLWVARREQEVAEEFSRLQLQPKPSSPIRSTFRLLMRHQKTGLQQLLPEFWFENGEWQDPFDKDRFQAALSKLHLEAVDPFELFRNLDDLDEEAEDEEVAAS
ncbi:AIPR family protein [Myxococcus sp. AS-1-15]|uniref:AIPR family protein n=1 Tax=Myxococcus sp. AS-1-15 TaxID=2874600 RepID=UPI001CBF3E00|nr:AIPR family protein [Myxococcus sp. AS-1-15]MBZ4402225.1 AIPR family protein [Myxococcus sp. AS-1-15]